MHRQDWLGLSIIVAGLMLVIALTVIVQLP